MLYFSETRVIGLHLCCW